ncbi:MAG: rod shape-determining protein MreD [Chloroflexota bacterium]|nr:rod shape-determining protein MreD [Chloroflexota bacterium]
MHRNFLYRIPIGIYLGLPLAALVALLQSTFTARIGVWGVSVDLTLLLAVSWTLLRGSGEGLLISLVGGVILDALSGAPFGVLMISLTAASELAGWGEANVFERARFLPPIAITLATIIYRGLLLMLLKITGRPLPPWPIVSRYLLLALIVNGLAMLIVYRLVERLCRLIQPRRAEWE